MQDTFPAAEAKDWARRLRAEFDQTFTEPLQPAAAGGRDFVLVAAGGTQWALALNGLGGIEHGHALVPVPSTRGALLGLAGVRNQAVPVFDLPALLGGGSQGAGKARPLAPAFALLDTGQGELAGGAFERLLQFARVAEEAIYVTTSLAPPILAPPSLVPARSGRPDRGGRASLHYEHEVYAVVEVEELLSRILAPVAAGKASQADVSQQAPDGEPSK